MYWLKFPAKVPSPTGPLIDHFTCIVKKKQQFQIEAKCQSFLVKMRFISLRIVKKIYLFSSFAPTLVYTMYSKRYARGNSDVAYLLGFGNYCHSKNKNASS